MFVIDGEKKVQQRRVTLAASPPGLAVIAGGLREGESVAADGLQRLRPGMVVNPVPAGAPAAPSPAAPRG